VLESPLGKGESKNKTWLERELDWIVPFNVVYCYWIKSGRVVVQEIISATSPEEVISIARADVEKCHKKQKIDKFEIENITFLKTCHQRGDK